MQLHREEPGGSVIIIISAPNENSQKASISVISGPNENSQNASISVNVLAANRQDEVFE